MDAVVDGNGISKESPKQRLNNNQRRPYTSLTELILNGPKVRSLPKMTKQKGYSPQWMQAYDRNNAT